MSPPDLDTPAELRASAVALAYEEGDKAPRVVAKGQGFLAQEIIDRARAAGVYVHESRELVGLLMQVNLDQTIPAELYVTVAELLAWLYSLEQRGHLPSPASLLGDIVQQAANKDPG
jgi:flagellar biosynthesis protein